MNRTLLLAAVLVALPLAAQAANICVWNYDTLDRWYDPALGDSADCAWRVVEGLTAMGHTVTQSNRFLPANLDGYDAVYCLMGWYRC